MKKNILIFMFIVLACFPIHSQLLFSEELENIEVNNTLLKALRTENDALKLQNLTGMNLADPEVSFTYMWGQPTDVPNKISVGVSQSFDFATLSGAKKRVANCQNNMIELDYKQNCLALMLEAEQELIGVVCYNALITMYDERISLLNRKSLSLHDALAKGEANVMEVNVADIELRSLQNDRQLAVIERDALLLELKRLNGGVELQFSAVEYPQVDVAKSFDEWYVEAEMKNPLLQYLRANIELSKEEISLSKSNNLPGFSVGYVNELVAGDNHHGVSVGLSIPLWSNSGKVKAAKASLNASQAQLEDAQLKFYVELQSQYERVITLQTLVNDYKDALTKLNNKAALDKSYELGHISILEYVQELQMYYDIIEKTILAERDYMNAYAQLTIYLY